VMSGGLRVASWEGGKPSADDADGRRAEERGAAGTGSYPQMTQMDAEVRRGAGGTGSYPQMTQMDAEVRGRGRGHRELSADDADGRRGRGDAGGTGSHPQMTQMDAELPGPSLPLGLGRTAPSRSRFASEMRPASDAGGPY
jgi:hypothetical protein